MVVELNAKIDHMHLVVITTLSLSVSWLKEFVKGRTAIRLFEKFLYLRKLKFFGSNFCQRGYYMDSVWVN
ncbi:hypothetical protein DQJ97_24185 [Salmonella enterica subsp. enterica serovar Poona]|nr:hypothetical protein [Salmonella enterica subsp. enterica serovar Poona]EBV3773929.1 hypothetical protein [Salmonella enterica subsp. enterica serovar Chester]ECA0340827.1 hypothetical protein [Salmonella enterica subsp. enterica serovar Richmond]ECF6834845.1 hypothetical protein [Salmonella enterica subsp. enterica]EGI6283811.1 hypothetical protein [Salmonella enterica subsp. enterica serovar Telhashomer]HBX1083511.1 transposase [Salmonella enterica]